MALDPANVMDNPRERLRDPAYFALHLKAAAALRAVGNMGWYDSHFLRRFEAARCYLADVRPDMIETFEAGFAPLKPRPGFRETVIEEVFDTETFAAILARSHAIAASAGDEQARENADFGRDVVWDDPFFLTVQEQVRPRVEALVGTPLTSCYNFLSRYGPEGKCNLHMDHPDAMYTFDFCIEQDEVWPIYVSRVVDWPTADFARRFDPEAIIADADYDFAEHLLRPNQALLFNGSSQWHYRRPKQAGGFCHLLFFHYVPAGCEALVRPLRWAAHFGIAELGPLCDLFADPKIDGLA
ncbi:MAG: hypothetical protein ACK4IS_05905 [Erythrobacter sp.]